MNIVSPVRSRALHLHSLFCLVREMSATVAMGYLFASLAGTVLLMAPLDSHGQNPSTPNRSVVAENYSKLPLCFEANEGQSDSKRRFESRGDGYSLFLTDASAVTALTKEEVVRAKTGEAGLDGLRSDSSLGEGGR